MFGQWARTGEVACCWDGLHHLAVEHALAKNHRARHHLAADYYARRDLSRSQFLEARNAAFRDAERESTTEQLRKSRSSVKDMTAFKGLGTS